MEGINTKNAGINLENAGGLKMKIYTNDSNLIETIKKIKEKKNIHKINK